MKKTLILLVSLVWLYAVADGHADDIVSKIMRNVAIVKKACPSAVPMAFWDFDGTIIKGDITIGLEEDGKEVLKGIIHRAIDEGLCKNYSAPDGWKRYSDDYERLNKLGCWIAYPYCIQAFEGQEVSVLDKFCEREVDKTYRHWYFAESIKIMKALEAAGVENYIVSASPEIFVRSTAKSLGLPSWRFRGIRVSESGGRVTTRLEYPIPYAEGKVDVVREILAARKGAVAVAGFGNSYHTDGEFLRFIATQSLMPGGAKGTSVMINGGGKVPGYSEHFICVCQ